MCITTVVIVFSSLCIYSRGGFDVAGEFAAFTPLWVGWQSVLLFRIHKCSRRSCVFRFHVSFFFGIRLVVRLCGLIDPTLDKNNHTLRTCTAKREIWGELGLVFHTKSFIIIKRNRGEPFTVPRRPKCLPYFSKIVALLAVVCCPTHESTNISEGEFIT